LGKLLLAVASTVILGSESCSTQDHLLLFKDFGPSGKLLLALATTVILGSKSSGDHDQILLGHDSESLGSLYIALYQTGKKTSPPAVSVLLCAYLLLWKHVLRSHFIAVITS
jgi:hypothetical protein